MQSTSSNSWHQLIHLQVGYRLNFGAYPEGSNMMYFTNYEIDQTNVDVLYNNGSPITSTSGLSTAPDHWWKLDASDTYDGTNWTIEDHVGSTNGTSSGMTQANLVQSDLSFTSGYSPYALDFDGTNDYITTAALSNFITNNVSVSAWVNFTTLPSGFSGAFLGMKNYFDEGLNFCSVNGVIRFTIEGALANSSPHFVENTVTLISGQWYHFCGTWDGSTIELFTNGISQGTFSYSGSITTSRDLEIGRVYNSGYSINGKISNVSIWNAGLTSTQVSEIYSEGVPQNLNNHSAYSNLVSWWQLGSNSSFNTNWTVLDEKGSNNGTSVNMTEDDIVDGVNTYGGGTSSGMGGDEVIGDAPYSSSNSLSVNMDVLDRVTDTPS